MDERIIKIATSKGLEIQSRQLMEECGELIQAMNKHYRATMLKEGAIVTANTNLASEIADVEIMMDQIKHLLKIETEVSFLRECKLERQMQRIEPVMVPVFKAVFGFDKASGHKKRTWQANGLDLKKGDIVEVENRNSKENVLVVETFELPKDEAIKHKRALRKVIY